MPSSALSRLPRAAGTSGRTDRELVKMARLEDATDLLLVRTGIFFFAV